MKKFLVSFIIGITLMAVGVTTLIFELNEYTITDEVTSDTFQDLFEGGSVSLHKDKLSVYLDDGLDVSWTTDNTMKDDEIILRYADYVEYRMDDERVYLSMTEHYNSFSGNVHDGWKVFQEFIDGLKEKKLYTFNILQGVSITCNETTRRNINTYYD